MKSIFPLLLCVLIVTHQSKAQSQTDVSVWLSETTINGTTLQILRAPETAMFHGQQGGCYFINSSGNKEYVERGLCK